MEEAVAQLKQLVRQAAARTRASLIEAMAAALAHITAADAWGFFHHCGYALPAEQDQSLSLLL